MKAVVFGCACAFLSLAGTAAAQGRDCNTLLPPVYAADPSGQTNANFQTLGRAISCLQDALNASQARLREAEEDLRDLRRQLDLGRFEITGGERVRIRACRSGEADIAYLPEGIPCASLGPAYQDERSGLPSYEVLVGR